MRERLNTWAVAEVGVDGVWVREKKAFAIAPGVEKMRVLDCARS